jgi:hypothetical protein
MGNPMLGRSSVGVSPTPRATRSTDVGGVWVDNNLWIAAAPTSSTDCYPCTPESAGRLARSWGVAGHGLVQLAEGLLDAGFEVVRTTGAGRAWRCWFGRELGHPCPGLVGDWAGLVALRAVEAIVRV